METPLTATQTSRSAALLPFNGDLKSGKANAVSNATGSSGRRALLDVTNDSPIVGLTVNRDEKCDASAEYGDSVKTPGSGEARLRSQVRSLLQRVDKETVKPPASTGLRAFLHLKGIQGAFTDSPGSCLAPTPANTPETSMLATEKFCVSFNKFDASSGSVSEADVQREVSNASETKVVPAEMPFMRPLVFNLLDDTEEDSVMTDSKNCAKKEQKEKLLEEDEASMKDSKNCSEKEQKENLLEDDEASEWSVHVNVSSPVADTADDVYEEEYTNFEEEEYQEEALYDEFDNLSVTTETVKGKSLPPPGKHTRFVYNSDDEIEEVVVHDSSGSSN